MVRIHLLTLHMISIVDGLCIMQTSTIIFSNPLKVSRERFSCVCTVQHMSRGGHQVMGGFPKEPAVVPPVRLSLCLEC